LDTLKQCDRSQQKVYWIYTDASSEISEPAQKSLPQGTRKQQAEKAESHHCQSHLNGLTMGSKPWQTGAPAAERGTAASTMHLTEAIQHCQGHPGHTLTTIFHLSKHMTYHGGKTVCLLLSLQFYFDTLWLNLDLKISQANRNPESLKASETKAQADVQGRKKCQTVLNPILKVRCPTNHVVSTQLLQETADVILVLR
jgi:hypothetical protein